MAFPQRDCVEWLEGRPVKRRGLAWFIPRPERANVDAKSEFEKLDNAARQNLQNRFDAWIDGDKPRKQYYHGWDEKGYENVWVFKYREHRIFGFLCHPDEPEDKAFLMCVLSSYTVKDGWEADATLKDLMKEFAADEAILQTAKEVHESDDCPNKKLEQKQK